MTPEPGCQASREEDQERSNAKNADFGAHIEDLLDVDMERAPVLPRRKHLNDLNAKEWIKFTKSWFILSGRADREKTKAHPATFPLELPTEFIEFFTSRNESVLDPFAGTGTTLAAADSLERNSTGIELQPEFIRFAQQRTEGTIHEGDALRLLSNPEMFPSNHFDYAFTSPPYMNALHKSRGGNRETRHKKRSERGEPLVYGERENDIGNIEDQAEYINRLSEIFQQVNRVLKPNRYCTVILQNLNFNGSMVPIAWKLGLALSNTSIWDMKGERIWCQDNKKLGIYGYPSAYATNNFHHYCLTFRKTE